MSPSLRRTFLLIMVATLAATQCTAQAPKPPPGPVNLTDILVKGGQFTYFLRLLNTTQVGNQINSQVNSSSEGLTVFSPTDNAFQNLKPGLINGLTMDQQVQLVLAHVLPKFYNFEDFQTVSNPVRTQGSGSDGEQIGVEITPIGPQQFNISTGIVTTEVNNALRSARPLAVYQVDKVLLPKELLSAKAPKSAPTKSSGSAESPSKSSSSSSGSSAEAHAPSAGFGLRSVGIEVVACVGLFTAGLIF